jgi:hypothetical protein
MTKEEVRSLLGPPKWVGGEERDYYSIYNNIKIGIYYDQKNKVYLLNAHPVHYSVGDLPAEGREVPAMFDSVYRFPEYILRFNPGLKYVGLERIKGFYGL